MNELKYGTLVKIKNLSDSLNNKVGKIVGIGSKFPGVTVYLVEFDNFISNIYPYKTVQIPDSHFTLEI